MYNPHVNSTQLNLTPLNRGKGLSHLSQGEHFRVEWTPSPTRTFETTLPRSDPLPDLYPFGCRVSSSGQGRSLFLTCRRESSWVRSKTLPYNPHEDQTDGSFSQTPGSVCLPSRTHRKDRGTSVCQWVFLQSILVPYTVGLRRVRSVGFGVQVPDRLSSKS